VAVTYRKKENYRRIRQRRKRREAEEKDWRMEDEGGKRRH
jgi:hypothetical protein